MLVVVIGVCLSVLILATASAQVCVPLGHSSLYLCICVVSCPYTIYFPTVMARYNLFELKVPLNPKQTNKQLLTYLL